ncbi:hypothetical protein P618_200212 [Holospora obtusa F1]|uniref:Alpha/beta hydrolase family protein n=1 Tax=Holospora obtusa F1 TaxID=1399147 RepID=W6TUY5_HOLOB|nr:hypothetical protein [Holospora obtusa]ETZ07577.1 hypothetical protein P618_200212 [Holospora obtusa F1]
MKVNSKYLIIFMGVLTVFVSIIGSYFYKKNKAVGFAFVLNKDRGILMYQGAVNKKFPLIVVHANKCIALKEYIFISKVLASRGFFVVIVQSEPFIQYPHTVNEDKIFVKDQTIFKNFSYLDLKKKSQNILYDIKFIKENEKKYNNVQLNLKNLILIGHECSSDILMNFSSLYPNLVSKIILLNNSKYPFPSNTNIKILRFSLADTASDQGTFQRLYQYLEPEFKI